MTQSQINRAVAQATGEDVGTISRLGFSLADPAVVRYDPEPCRLEPQIGNGDAANSEDSLARH